jgi:hypothetical protein
MPYEALLSLLVRSHACAGDYLHAIALLQKSGGEYTPAERTLRRALWYKREALVMTAQISNSDVRAGTVTAAIDAPREMAAREGTTVGIAAVADAVVRAHITRTAAASTSGSSDSGHLAVGISAITDKAGKDDAAEVKHGVASSTDQTEGGKSKKVDGDGTEVEDDATRDGMRMPATLALADGGSGDAASGVDVVGSADSAPSARLSFDCASLSLSRTMRELALLLRGNTSASCGNGSAAVGSDQVSVSVSVSVEASA